MAFPWLPLTSALYEEENVSQIRMYITWPIIFCVAWYFFSFQIAAIISFIYLHVLTILLFNVTEKQKDKLVEIVEHIINKDGLVDPQSLVDPTTIETAEDVINAISSLKKASVVKE